MACQIVGLALEWSRASRLEKLWGCQSDSHSDKVKAQTPNVLVYQLHGTCFLFLWLTSVAWVFLLCAFQMLVSPCKRFIKLETSTFLWSPWRAISSRQRTHLALPFKHYQTLGLEEYVTDTWLAIIFTNVELWWSTPNSQLLQTTSYQDPARLSYLDISWVVPAISTTRARSHLPCLLHVWESCFNFTYWGGEAQEGRYERLVHSKHFWWIPGSLTDREGSHIPPNGKRKIIDSKVPTGRGYVSSLEV